MPKDREPEFKVTDRRKFTSEGEMRPDVPEPIEEVKQAEPVAPFSSAEHAREKVAPAPEPQQRDVHEEVVAPQELMPETGYDAEKMRGAFGGQKIEFVHLLDMLVQTAMMYAGAMDNGPERRVDIVGMRQMIDMIAMIEEKTKGNLTEQEQTILSSTLFQLRMTYMEIVNMIEKQAVQGGPGAPGGSKK
jgi:hypothetical protein